jgi:group I intron endonuclease
LLKQKKIRTNKLNGESYIGSSVNLGRRLSEYFSSKYLNSALDRGKSRIYSALIKYGYSKFKLEILEYCPPEQCEAREQYYLDHLEREYNILPKADSSLGQNHSEGTKAKISKALRKA